MKQEPFSRKPSFAILKVRSILTIGISDVLLKGIWKPVKQRIDINEKYQTKNELHRKIEDRLREFREIEAMKENHEF